MAEGAITPARPDTSREADRPVIIGDSLRKVGVWAGLVGRMSDIAENADLAQVFRYMQHLCEVLTVCPSCSLVSDSVPCQRCALRALLDERDEALRIARRAVNTWGVFARRGTEQDAIIAMRAEIDAKEPTR